MVKLVPVQNLMSGSVTNMGGYGADCRAYFRLTREAGIHIPVLPEAHGIFIMEIVHLRVPA